MLYPYEQEGLEKAFAAFRVGDDGQLMLMVRQILMLHVSAHPYDLAIMFFHWKKNTSMSTATKEDFYAACIAARLCTIAKDTITDKEMASKMLSHTIGDYVLAANLADFFPEFSDMKEMLQKGAIDAKKGIVAVNAIFH